MRPDRAVALKAAPRAAFLPRWRRLLTDWRLLPLLPVLAAVIFNQWLLRAELAGVQNLNDSAFHLAAVRWAARQIQHGHLPLDGWFPNLALGFPLFHSYQTLPHLIISVIGAISSVDRAFYWSLYLTLTSWPVAVYASVRLFGLSRWAAATAAMVSPLLVSITAYGFEHGSYTWRGTGLWSQIFAMWLLPLAMALAWRSIHQRRSPLMAGIALGLTIVCHLQTGYLAILGMGVFVLVDRRAFLSRVARAGLVVLGGLLTASYLLIPMTLDGRYIQQSQFMRGTVFADSFGAGKILGWLIRGQLFDGIRTPGITPLVLLGAVVCVIRFRRDPLARALLGFAALCLALFFGRPTWGPALGLLPGSSDLLFHRFIGGLHLAGVWLAGVGAVWLARVMVAGLRRIAVPAPVAVSGVLAVCGGALLLHPAFIERAAFDNGGTDMIRAQAVDNGTDGANFDRLVSRLPGLPPGRVYAGLPDNWGGKYRIGQVPVYVMLLNRDLDSIGFVGRMSSLNADIEAGFDETNPFQYQMLGIRYLVLPRGQSPAVPATFIERQGRHTLWSVDAATGYLQVVDTAGTIRADRTNLARQTTAFRAQRTTLGGPYPTVEFPGRPAARPTSDPANPPPGPAGEVESDRPLPADGVFAGEVTANREAVVVLKSTFSPRWQATVDGQTVPTQMIAPALIGVRVPPGHHTVVFRYRNFNGSLPLMAVAALGLFVISRAWRRWPWLRSLDETVHRAEPRVSARDPRSGDLARRAWALLRAYPFEALVVFAALVYTALALSPSSYGWALRILGVSDTGTYFGTPKLDRWDEWAIQTPYIQALVRGGYRAHNLSSFYGEPFRNIISLPVKDWGLLFRPLFWGYTFLPPAWAFSFYFAAAAALTLTGWVVALRRVGVTYLLAIAASVAIFFAPFTQAWWSALAPICALFPWVLVVFTSRARLRYLALPCAWLAASCVASAAYMPGLVLAGFAGAAFLAAFVVRRQNVRRLLLLGVAAAVGAGIGLVYLAPVLRVLADTVYPGHRVVPGGDLPLSQWLSQLSPFGVTRGYHTLLPKNLPESTALGSWLPLLAVVLVDYRRVLRGEARSALRPLAVLAGAFLLLSGWQLIDGLHWLGSVFLWNRALEQRSLMASGPLLVMASVWVLSRFPIKFDLRRAAVFVGLMLVASGAAALGVTRKGGLGALLANAHDNLMAVAVCGLLALVMAITSRRWRIPAGVIALLTVLPCAAAWALYNPVQDTRPIFKPILTDMTRTLDREAAKRPDGAIAGNFPGSMLNGLGYRSVVHTLALPELDDFTRLFPDLEPRAFNTIFNRYLEVYFYGGAKPTLAGEGVVYLPTSVVQRYATITSVSGFPLPAKF